MNLNIPIILTTVLVLAVSYLGWLQFKTMNRKLQSLTATVTTLQENMKTLRSSQSENVNFDIKNIDSLIEKYENELHETQQADVNVEQNADEDEDEDSDEQYYQQDDSLNQEDEVEDQDVNDEEDVDFTEVAEVEEVLENENSEEEEEEVVESTPSQKINLDLTHPDDSEIKVIVTTELEKIKRHYAKKTKNELKDILKSFNKSLTGSKDTLISRILEVEQLKNINI